MGAKNTPCSHILNQHSRKATGGCAAPVLSGRTKPSYAGHRPGTGVVAGVAGLHGMMVEIGDTSPGRKIAQPPRPSPARLKSILSRREAAPERRYPSCRSPRRDALCEPDHRSNAKARRKEIAMKTIMLAAAAVMSLGMTSAFATTATRGQAETRVAQLNLDVQSSQAAKMLPVSGSHHPWRALVHAAELHPRHATWCARGLCHRRSRWCLRARAGCPAIETGMWAGLAPPRRRCLTGAFLKSRRNTHRAS